MFTWFGNFLRMAVGTTRDQVAILLFYDAVSGQTINVLYWQFSTYTETNEG